MSHRHLWEMEPEALPCYCGDTNDLEGEIDRVRRGFRQEVVDDVEIAMLKQRGFPVTVKHLARWGGWAI